MNLHEPPNLFSLDFGGFKFTLSPMPLSTADHQQNHKKQLVGVFVIAFAFYGIFQLLVGVLSHLQGFGSHPSVSSAQQAMARKDYPQALSTLAQILRQSPQDAAARNTLAVLYSQLNQWEDAEKQWLLAEQAARESLEKAKQGLASVVQKKGQVTTHFGLQHK